jgi:iron complex outermembrane receptor protein
MHKSKYSLVVAVAVCATISAWSATTFAQAPTADAAAAPAELEAITVTGSRIIREGYESPTPLSVVSSEQLQSGAQGNVADMLVTLPQFVASQTPNTQYTQNTPSGGLTGLNLLNFRGLGPNRTLVLVDGQRWVPTLTYGSVSTEAVDIDNIPQQLITRVETVTGGASAVYGSDAVGGVANFILDKKFTGFKTDVSGGVTTYGDDGNYKIDVTAGFGFAGDRGHVVLSAEQYDKNDLTNSTNRSWNAQGYCTMPNPAWTSTNGQAFRITTAQCGDVSAPGGLILTGPLRGVMFGPGGTPLPFQFGAIGGGQMTGGAWQIGSVDQLLTRGASLDPGENHQNFYSRVGYDLTDRVEVSNTFSWSDTQTNTQNVDDFYDGAGINISSNNAFIPASLRPSLAGTSSFQLSTLNGDLPVINTFNDRIVFRDVLSFDGKLDLFKTTWTWNAYYQYGESQNSLNAQSVSRSRYANAVNAVVDPTTGAIICAANANGANGAPGCVPYNVFGTGVNSQAALDYVNGVGHLNQANTQQVWAASATGEPFSLWAGPVSLASDLEYRKEKAYGDANAGALANDYFSGNYKPIDGSYNVAEGALETLIPLAKDYFWAKSWDLNLAARATDYSTSGYVTTWKIGSTFSPVSDLMFRGNVSRDIRAGNLGELFAFSGAPIPSPGFNDPFTNTSQTPRTYSTGNPNLKPEDAKDRGFGVVYQPSWLRGFSTSVDYWRVAISDAIETITPTQQIQLCYSGNKAFCSGIIRSGAATIPGAAGTPYAGQFFAPLAFVVSDYANLASQDSSGIDAAATYRFALNSLLPSADGNVTLSWNQSFYFKGSSNPGVPGSLTNYTSPFWRAVGNITYDNKPWAAGLTFRAQSANAINYTQNPQIIQCGNSCPLMSSLPANITTYNYFINQSAWFMDANVAYDLKMGGAAEGQIYLNIRNLLNTPPPLEPAPAEVYAIDQSNAGDDMLGRIFRLGVRFKM